MDDLFINTTEEEAIKIAKHIKCEYVGISNISGAAIFKIINMSYWKYYKKYFNAELVKVMYDNIGVYMNPPSYIIKEDFDYFLIKIFEHDPELFNHNIREEKLKRILKNKL